MKLNRLWHLPFLLLAIVVGFYIRIVNPWKQVFSWSVLFGGNDPWYYYRLIDNCVHNFPYRIWFDPFTHYPFGTFTHFGPFLVYFGAILCKIFGATKPIAMRSVLVFVPTIGGALIALPTYLFAKEVFGKKAGVISALLVVIIPGQLLARSILGFNDHHIWEAFWMTTALGLYCYALKRRDYLSAVLAGIGYGMYLLTWAPAFYLALFYVIYVFLLIVLSSVIGFEIERPILVTAITVAVALLMFLPFAFNTPFLNTIEYSPFQPIVLLACLFMLGIFYGLYELKEKGKLSGFGVRDEYVLSGTVIAVFVLLTIALFFISPDFSRRILRIVRVVQPKGGALTVAEMQPFFYMGGQFSLAPAYLNFGMAFFFGFFGFLLVCYEFYKKRDSLRLLVILWSLMMFVALCGQNRFAYYFGVVSAIMAGYMLDYLLRKLEFYKALEDKKVNYTRVGMAVILIILLFAPTFSLAYNQSKYAGTIPKPWWDALVWMRNNTPEKTQYDKYYYKLYKPPKDWRKPYPYPFKTYGVISWWDYGHWIEAIAHRMPIANPFQQGIGNKYHNVPGASSFFTAFNESYANEIAKKLNVKYVVSDVEMLTGKFYAMAVWAEGSIKKADRIYFTHQLVYMWVLGNRMGFTTNPYRIPTGAKIIGEIVVPSVNYFKTMEARLHLMDGCGLSHYRMVYESSSSAGTFMGLEEMIYRSVFDSMYAKSFGIPKVNVTPTGFVKVFEFVKGVKVTGKADAKSVTVSVKIKTNQNRTFIWEKTVPVVNGTYSVVVPYAQNTTYPVKPVGDYTIRAGNIVKHFSVTDEQVEKGAVLRIDLT